MSDIDNQNGFSRVDYPGEAQTMYVNILDHQVNYHNICPVFYLNCKGCICDTVTVDYLTFTFASYFCFRGNSPMVKCSCAIVVGYMASGNYNLHFLLQFIQP